MSAPTLANIEELVLERRIRHRGQRSSIHILIAIMESAAVVPRIKTELVTASRLNNKHFEKYFCQLLTKH